MKIEFVTVTRRDFSQMFRPDVSKEDLDFHMDNNGNFKSNSSYTMDGYSIIKYIRWEDGAIEHFVAMITCHTVYDEILQMKVGENRIIYKNRFTNYEEAYIMFESLKPLNYKYENVFTFIESDEDREARGEDIYCNEENYGANDGE